MRPLRDQGLQAVLDGVTDGLILLDEAAVKLADADAAEAITELLSRRVDLSADRVMRAIEAPSEAALTVICRAAGLNGNGFSAILRMRRRHLPSDVSPAEVLAAFLETSLGTAREVVSMLKLRDIVELPE
ncbi:MAG TPA: hypothetical protein VEK55_08115 [Xanthobacteraceae bacterium]|nr:hypothetical protein [Xanthobacteraceae bacterium]